MLYQNGRYRDEGALRKNAPSRFGTIRSSGGLIREASQRISGTAHGQRITLMASSITAMYAKSLRALGNFKNHFIRDEVRYRRVWLGLCRGSSLPLNLRHSTRMMLGLYELEIAHYFRAFSNPGGCLYDIGARHGYYSLAFARLAAPARIHAFEPDRQSYTLLNEVIARNRSNSRIEAHELFLGSIVNQREKAETLDDLVFAKGFDAPDLLKIDVDGPEYEILCGANKVLTECKPRLIVEVHSPQLEIDCKTMLEQSGYAVNIVKNNPLLRERRPIELNRWLTAKPL